MSMDSIRQIENAENEARQIIEKAKQDAEAMRTNATQKGENQLKRIEAETNTEIQEIFSRIHCETAEIAQTNQENTLAEIDELRDKVKLKHGVAQKIVLGGLQKKCL